jgi:hypothetical protein
MRTISISIWPGSMESIGQALDVFGCNRVVPGAWNEPVMVSDLTPEEYSFAQGFFGGLGFEVKDINQVQEKDEVVAPQMVHSF